MFTAIESSRIYIFTYISLMKHFRSMPPAPRRRRRDATLGQMLVLLCAIFVVYAHAGLLIFRHQWEVLQVRGSVASCRATHAHCRASLTACCL